MRWELHSRVLRYSAKALFASVDPVLEARGLSFLIFRNGDQHAPLKYLIDYTIKRGQPFLPVAMGDAGFHNRDHARASVDPHGELDVLREWRGQVAICRRTHERQVVWTIIGIVG